MNEANSRQEGGDHYGGASSQHWDFTWKYGYNQFEYSSSKYVIRHKNKDGTLDLRKGLHHLEKYLEVTDGLVEDPLNRSISDIIQLCVDYKLDDHQIKIIEAIHLGKIKEAKEWLEVYINLQPVDPS